MHIHWPAFDGHPFKIGAPGQVELLQVADTSASAIFHAVEPDQFGNPEPRYVKELGPKLYRHGTARVTSYGLKVSPTSQCAQGTPLAWLGDL